MPKSRRLVFIATFVTLIGLILSPQATAAGLFVDDVSNASDAKATDAEVTDSDIGDPPHWSVEWLAAFDKNNNSIDDEAENVALDHVGSDNPSALVSVLITYNTSPGLNEQKNLVDVFGAHQDMYVFHHIPTINAQIPASNVAGLGAAAGVLAVEYDRPVAPLLQVSAPATQAREGTGANTFYNGETGQALGYTGEGMVVAVLDTGVNDVGHAPFNGKFVTGANVSTPVIAGCVNPVDDEGHGTHVASTALGNNSGSVVGTAFSARLVDIKISLTVGSLGGIDRGFDWVLDYNEAIDDGTPICGVTLEDRIDVATLSFGSVDRGGPNAGTTEGLVDALVGSGVAVTIAVGNCGPQPSDTCLFDGTAGKGDDDNGISSPGNAAGAIGVASFNDVSTVNRADDVISGFSSRGPNSSGGDSAAGGATNASNLKDRHRKPDIAAPGDGIQAAGPVPFTLSTSSGTSMATPHVAGIASLLLQAGEQAKAQTGGVNLMASTGNGFANDTYVSGSYPVRDALIHAPDYKVTGARDLWTGLNSTGLRWNNAWGYGQVNAFAALCWSWANVLVPGGATPTPQVEALCDLTPNPLSALAGGPYGGLINTPISILGSASGGISPYSFSWSLTSAPSAGNGVFGDTSAASTTFTPDTPGIYELNLTVTDAAATVASATATLTAVEPGGAEAVLYQFDFDGAPDCSDPEGWTVDTPAAPENLAINEWHQESFRPHTPPCQWYHGDPILGIYESQQHTNLVSPDSCFVLDPSLVGSRFSFQVAGELEFDFDFLRVQVSDCGANTWSNLAEFTGVHGSWLEDPAVYEELSADLTDFIGTGQFQLRLRIDTDDGNLGCQQTDDPEGLICPGYQVDTFRLFGTPGSNTPPVANIAGPTQLLTGEAGHFDGTGSTDADGTIVSYEWDMGDGTLLSGGAVDYAWGSAGVFTVSLKVIDDLGVSDIATQEVTVELSPDDLPQVHITTPTDGSNVADEVVPVEGFVDRGAAAPSGGGTLFLVGDGSTTLGVDTPTLENKNFDLSSLGNGNKETIYVANAGNNAVPENPFMPTFVSEEPVFLSGGPVKLFVHVRYAGALFCPLDAALFDSSGNSLSDGVLSEANVGLGPDFEAAEFDFTPASGQYAGLMVQFGSSFLDCGRFTQEWVWGTDEFNGRLELGPNDGLINGPLGPGEERVELFLDGSSTPFDTVPVATDETSPTGDWASQVDLTGMQGCHLITANWIEADDRLVDTDESNVCIQTNQPPDANDDSVGTKKNKSVTLNVLANDSDADGDPITLASHTQGMPGSKTTCNSQGTCTYTPKKGFTGNDSFQYTISDGQGGTDTATVKITIGK